MKPPAFDYLRARTTDEALRALRAEGAEARILAGGQSLLPMLNMRLARPALLVDIMDIAALQMVAVTKDGLRIGAAVRQATLETRRDLAQECALLAAVLPWIGHWQTRNRGTICGSVAHADPSAEISLILVALGGTVHLRSARRAKSIAAADFFTGMMVTARADDEMIEAVTLPLNVPGTGYAFREIGRRHGDFAIAAAAARVDAKAAVLAVGGVADRPLARTLPLPGDASLDDALDEFSWALEARDDFHATGEYRRMLVRRMGRAVIEEAVSCRA